MPGRVEGKVAFITGAARGQGRSHAVRLAQEGADIIAVDICEQVNSVPYPLATQEDLARTAELVQQCGRRIVTRVADVRDFDVLTQALDDGVSELGRLDIVAANAGIWSPGRVEQLSDPVWRDMIDINLTGVWHTAKAAIPHLRAGGEGGSICLTSSVAGLKGGPGIVHYITAKHGLVGLMRALAMELAPERIRVNSVCPTQVNTDMLMNDSIMKVFVPDQDVVPMDRFMEVSQSINALPVPWVESIDVSNALLFLASDEARYITGVAFPVDAGGASK
jgi:(+)-trans-carveol dehydrogenase